MLRTFGLTSRSNGFVSKYRHSHLRFFNVSHKQDSRIIGIKEKEKNTTKLKFFPVDYSGTFDQPKEDVISVTSLDQVKKKIGDFFLPKNYPQSVNDDYWDVQKYWNVQWAVASALQVFATHSLLTAVGVGSAALPLAATANWVLKVNTE